MSGSNIPIEEISNLFHAADADRNGILSYDELANIMTAISSGNRPPDHIIQQCYETMDINKNGEIDEQEFINVILNWLNKQSEAQQTHNKKRNNGQIMESLSPNLGQRKKIMTNITNFFRQFTPISNYEEEQKRILRNNPLSNLNLLTIHREYPQLPSQEKLEKYEMIKSILQNGREVLIQEINSFDWNVVVNGIQKVQFILSIVELFSTPEERSRSSPPPPPFSSFSISPHSL
jgi:hypothetical protein